MNIIIVKPTEKHIEQMIELSDQARQHHIEVLGGYFKPINPSVELEITKRYMDQEDRIALIAVDTDDNVVGMILGCVSDKPWLVNSVVGHVDNFIVSKNARGHGVGKKLMNGFIQECKNRGVQEITLGVYNKNKGPYDFYIQYGFEPIEQKMTMKL